MTGTSNRRVSPPCCETASNHLPNGPPWLPREASTQATRQGRGFAILSTCKLGSAVRSSPAQPTRRGGQPFRNRHGHVHRPLASLGHHDPGCGLLAPTRPLPPRRGWPILDRRLARPLAPMIRWPRPLVCPVKASPQSLYEAGNGAATPPKTSRIG